MEKKKRSAKRGKGCFYIFITSLQLTLTTVYAAMELLSSIVILILRGLLITLFFTIGITLILTLPALLQTNNPQDILFVQAIAGLTGAMIIMWGFKLAWDLFSFQDIDRFLHLPRIKTDSLENIMTGRTTLQMQIENPDYILKPGIGEGEPDSSRLEDHPAEPDDIIYYYETQQNFSPGPENAG